MTNKDDLLFDFMRFGKHYLESRGKKKGIQKAIQRKSKYLYHRYGITRTDICANFYFTLRRRKIHLKFDPSRSSLESYVAWSLFYLLLTMVQQCQRHLQKSNTIPLSELEIGQKISGRLGCSVIPYENRGIYELINPNSPEDEYIGKELIHIAHDFFGDDDLSVLLGLRDRSDEAERLGIDYYTYCKKLKRKTLQFRCHLEEIGYID